MTQQQRSNQETARILIEQIGHHLDRIDNILNQLARLGISKDAVVALGDIRPMLRRAREDLKD